MAGIHGRAAPGCAWRALMALLAGCVVASAAPQLLAAPGGARGGYNGRPDRKLDVVVVGAGMAGAAAAKALKLAPEVSAGAWRAGGLGGGPRMCRQDGDSKKEKKKNTGKKGSKGNKPSDGNEGGLSLTRRHAEVSSER